MADRSYSFNRLLVTELSYICVIIKYVIINMHISFIITYKQISAN